MPSKAKQPTKPKPAVDKTRNVTNAGLIPGATGNSVSNLHQIKPNALHIHPDPSGKAVKKPKTQRKPTQKPQ